MYQALIEKNTEYESVFFVGVITTGIFCRPACPARKPKFEHCEFFETAKEAPERRWKGSDFQQLSIDATMARRQFKTIWYDIC